MKNYRDNNHFLRQCQPKYVTSKKEREYVILCYLFLAEALTASCENANIKSQRIGLCACADASSKVSPIRMEPLCGKNKEEKYNARYC